jgi:hypothetical protein
VGLVLHKLLSERVCCGVLWLFCVNKIQQPSILILFFKPLFPERRPNENEDFQNRSDVFCKNWVYQEEKLLLLPALEE